MASLFMGKKALRPKFFQVTDAQLNAALTPAAAYGFAKVDMESRLGLLSNGTNADLAIYVVHPEADPTDVSNRLFLLEIPRLTVFNLDASYAMNISIDPGTWFYVVKTLGTVNPNEKLRGFFWG